MRRRILLAATPGLLAAPALRAQIRDKLTLMTNWRAQAEHGGFYQALAGGLYREAGIDVDIRPGGPQENASQLMIAGRVDIILSDAFQALNYVREGIPFLCVAAPFQKDPQCFLTHEEGGYRGFEDMKGKPVLISVRHTFWPWLRAKYGFTDEQVRPYTFNLAPFLQNKAAIQQAYLSSEPYAARLAGASPKVHLFADHGYDNYQNALHTSRKLVDEKPDLVQRFVDASLKGWTQYLKAQDVAAANALILRHNPEMTQDKIDYAIRAMNEHGIVQSGDALRTGAGAMTAERWLRLYALMRDAQVYPPGLPVERAFSLAFVNRGVGL